MGRRGHGGGRAGGEQVMQGIGQLVQGPLSHSGSVGPLS